MTSPTDNDPDDPGPAVEPDPGIPFEEYARSRREGAFVSPCGTEGCQWDGFPEPPDGVEEE